MITIKTITTAINMIPSVEPASSTASAAATIVSVCRVGVAVASWAIGEGRLSARLVNAMAIPSKTQNAMRMFFDFVFIVFGWVQSITPRVL